MRDYKKKGHNSSDNIGPWIQYKEWETTHITCVKKLKGSVVQKLHCIDQKLLYSFIYCDNFAKRLVQKGKQQVSKQ